MMNHNNTTIIEDTGSGYASDQEEEERPTAISESFTSYLSGMFDSDDDEDDDDDDTASTSSKQMMPPPPRAFTIPKNHPTSSSSEDGTTSPPSGTGYASGRSSTSCSPLTSSGTDTPPSSDEERWEIHYLNKKRKLLTKAINLMNREEVYNASIAGSLVGRQTFDSPLWMEAKKMAGFTSEASRHSSIHQRKSLLGTKRPRIDLSSVYHVKGDIHSDIFMPTLCTVETKKKKKRVPPTPVPAVVVTSEEESATDTRTMDLSHAIAFSPIAQ